jgi:GDPmannose 4,6-dehydratase
LQQEISEDFVIATGVTTRVREFIRKTFAFLGVEVTFTGTEENEVGTIASINAARLAELGIQGGEHLKSGTTILKIDPRYYRPTEVELLIGDPTKSNEKLGWKPKHTLDTLIEDMATSDLRLFQKDQLLLKEGFGVLNYFE